MFSLVYLRRRKVPAKLIGTLQITLHKIRFNPDKLPGLECQVIKDLCKLVSSRSRDLLQVKIEVNNGVVKQLFKSHELAEVGIP